MSSIKLGGAWQAHHNQLLGLQMDAAALRGKLSASRKQIRISKQRQGIIIEPRNYQMIGMYFMIKHRIKVPQHVFSMIIAGLLLDICG